MSAQGGNEGFHVLDDYVCEAIHTPSMPLASRSNQGRNAGMSVIEELRSAGQVDDLRSVIEPVANFIAASGQPRATLARFMERLYAELGVADREDVMGLPPVLPPVQ